MTDIIKVEIIKDSHPEIELKQYNLQDTGFDLQANIRENLIIKPLERIAI